MPPPRDAYPRIFLSYRRDDSEAYAGRLYETLAREFGADGVFIDLFGIRPGEFYPWTIQQAAAHAAVFVTLIGPKWLQLADSSGRRRLDVPEDYVRREITTALDRGTPIIPLLLPGVDFIDPTLLPDEMLGLERRQALQLIPRHWNADIGEVIAEIRRRLG